MPAAWPPRRAPVRRRTESQGPPPASPAPSRANLKHCRRAVPGPAQPGPRPPLYAWRLEGVSSISPHCAPGAVRVTPEALGPARAGSRPGPAAPFRATGPAGRGRPACLGGPLRCRYQSTAARYGQPVAPPDSPGGLFLSRNRRPTHETVCGAAVCRPAWSTQFAV